MSFLKKLPEFYVDAQLAARKAHINVLNIEEELEATDHDCDCEYCDRASSALMGREKEEKQKELEEATALYSEYELTVKRIERYADLIKVQLITEKKK